jgi:hypothetical protein
MRANLMTAGQAAAMPAWVREPDRSAVREHVVEMDGRRFCLHIAQRQLLELTELRGGVEALVPRESDWWQLFELEVGAGAYDDND